MVSLPLSLLFFIYLTFSGPFFHSQLQKLSRKKKHCEHIEDNEKWMNNFVFVHEFLPKWHKIALNWCVPCLTQNKFFGLLNEQKMLTLTLFPHTLSNSDILSSMSLSRWLAGWQHYLNYFKYWNPFYCNTFIFNTRACDRSHFVRFWIYLLFFSDRPDHSHRPM